MSSRQSTGPQVFSPGTSLNPRTLDNLLTETKYYDRRGVNEDEYLMAMEQINPNRAPIAHIFRAYDNNPLASRVEWGVDQETREQGYMYDEDGELVVNKVDRISEAIYPVVHVEMYKFMEDVLTEVDDILKKEDVKTANPVHLLKALIKTGYFPIIEDYLDYYSTYQGYDFDLETAKLEL